MLRAFGKDERGNFAIVTCLMATVLVGALGGAIDLSSQWIDQSTVQRAADAAALAGAKALETGTETDARRAVEVVGQANLPSGFPSVAFEVQIDEAAGTVNVAGSGSTEPHFLELFNINTLPIGASAQALIQRKSFIDFYFLLDVSESMNIAASDADRVTLETYTGNAGTGACAFACHSINYDVNPPRSWFTLSREAGVRLRIDVLRDASKGMVDKILDLNNEPGSLKSTRIATAGFNSSFTIGTGPTDQRTTAKSSIDTLITSSNSLPSHAQHTNIRNALQEWRLQQLKTQGTGSSANNVKKFAILVTDGVRDDDPWFRWWGMGPVEPWYCDAIKNLGIELAVLEIKYVKDYDRGNFFRDRVSWYYDQISPNMKTCASSGLYALALDSNDAQTQLFKLVDAILTVRRRLAS